MFIVLPHQLVDSRFWFSSVHSFGFVVRSSGTTRSFRLQLRTGGCLASETIVKRHKVFLYCLPLLHSEEAKWQLVLKGSSRLSRRRRKLEANSSTGLWASSTSTTIIFVRARELPPMNRPDVTLCVRKFGLSVGVFSFETFDGGRLLNILARELRTMRSCIDQLTRSSSNMTDALLSLQTEREFRLLRILVP